MLDLYNLPSANSGDEQIFIGTVGAGTYLDFHTWRKPRGCSMVHILAVGGGAGGGGGAGWGATSGAGGGGGGSGTVVSVWVFASFLPEVLYIWVDGGGVGGTGASGGANGGAGANGTTAFVTVEPILVGGLPPINNRIAAATGGNPGSGGIADGAGGNGATSASIPVIANMPLAGLGFYQFIPGHIGGQGWGAIGGSSDGMNMDLQGPGLFLTGGGGSGADDGLGGLSYAGQITGKIIAPIGLANVATAGSNGINGFQYRSSRNPFLCTGTTGGSGGFVSTIVPYTAGPGCGGAGGIGGSTFGCDGQRGGPGFVIITAW